MNKNFVLVLLRLALGWVFLYAGLAKLASHLTVDAQKFWFRFMPVSNEPWSAYGYLANAKTFSSFYGWLASPDMLSVVNFVNEWGLTLLGISLIFGVFVRWSSPLGAALMILYYFPALDFPYLEHSYLVDEHIIYALTLVYFALNGAGNIFGIDGWWSRRKVSIWQGARGFSLGQ